MKRLWLTFAQATTVALAALFVVATLRPEWLQGTPRIDTPPIISGEAGGLELRQAVQDNPVARAGSYSDAVRKAAPAVVNIFTSKEVKAARHPFLSDPLLRQFFGDRLPEQAPSQRATGLGSGVIISPRGYVLTNHHVVEAADEIEVGLANGKKLRARLVGSDPESDLAVLQIQAEGLPVITFGDDQGLRLGDIVLAIGNPLGIGQTVTMGIVSGLHRTGLGINTFENFIQTDAAINQGNSGGALIDAAGNLVGINTAILSQTGGSIGIGFAIPASTARSVTESIIAKGSVVRGWIGVEAQEITRELAESFKLPGTEGALIANVIAGGPAARAGVKSGDVLRAVDGKRVGNPGEMLNLVAALAPGQSSKLTLWRAGQELLLTIEVGTRPAQGKRGK
jgi:Do/DeqQ family serine protease